MAKTTATRKRRRDPETDTDQEKIQEQKKNNLTAGQTPDSRAPLAHDQDQLELAAAASLVSLTTAPSPVTRSSKPKSTAKARLSQNTAVPAVSTSAPSLSPPTPETSSSSSSSSAATSLAPVPVIATAVSTAVSTTSTATSTALPSSTSSSFSSNITPQERIEFLERLEQDSQEKIKKLEDKVAKLKENDKVLQSKAEASFRRLKEIREKYKEAEVQLKNQERRIGTLQLELQKAQPQPIVKAPVGTGLRIDKYKRKRGKKLNEDERRLVLHCLEMCRLEQELAPSIATGDPYLRAAVYMGMSTHTVRDTSLDRNLEDKRTREEREKRATQSHDQKTPEGDDTMKEGENEVEGIEAENSAASSAHSARAPESLCAPTYVPHDLHHVIHQSVPSAQNDMFAAYEDF